MAALVLALLPVAAPAAADVDPPDGTFERGTHGWTARPAESTRLEQVPGGRSGAHAARVTNTGAGARTTVLDDVRNSVRTTAPGRQYRVSAWVRAVTPGTSLVLRTMEYDGGVVQTQQDTLWARDTRWHRLETTVTARRSGSELDVNVVSWRLAPGRALEVDDVEVVAVDDRPPGRPGSAAADRVLPSPGDGALFGYYQNGAADPEPMEDRIGRRFDLVHHYEDFNGAGSRWPTARQERQAAGGRTVHVTWELVSYDGGHDPSLQPAPALRVANPHQGGRQRSIWTYRQVLSGQLDRHIDATADRLNASPHDYVVNFNHEMDDLPDVGGSNTLRAAAGSRAEYRDAYRYVVDRMRARGVDNVVWGWAVSGWYASDPRRHWSYQQLWPGSDYVDLVMWNPYNNSSERWRSFGQLVAPFYDALDGGMLDAVDPSAKDLPVGLAEFGARADPRRPAWLRSLPSEARRYPDLVALGYFSSGSWGALHNDPAAVAAFAAAGQDPYLRPRG